MENSKIIISKAITDNDIESARLLFVEYAESLNFDLCFQGFEEELKNLPGDYSYPCGEILLAYCDNKLAGCVALRKFEDGICEMKRLYVKPGYRGKKIGKLLSVKLIDDARKMGYKKMRLDTLETMTEAIAIYKTLGFKEITPYRFNPIKNVHYLELEL